MDLSWKNMPATPSPPFLPKILFSGITMGIQLVMAAMLDHLNCHLCDKQFSQYYYYFYFFISKSIYCIDFIQNSYSLWIFDDYKYFYYIYNIFYFYLFFLSKTRYIVQILYKIHSLWILADYKYILILKFFFLIKTKFCTKFIFTSICFVQR